MQNVQHFFDLGEKIIDFFLDYFISLFYFAKCKAKHEDGLKILTPKQIIQRLPIALAQVKTVNTSENLLNEMKQIIYSLYL